DPAPLSPAASVGARAVPRDRSGPSRSTGRTARTVRRGRRPGRTGRPARVRRSLPAPALPETSGAEVARPAPPGRAKRWPRRSPRSRSTLARRLRWQPPGRRAALTAPGRSNRSRTATLECSLPSVPLGAEGRRKDRRLELIGTTAMKARGLDVQIPDDAFTEGESDGSDEVRPGRRLHGLANHQEPEVPGARAGARAAADVKDDVAVVVPIRAEGDPSGLGVTGQGGERERLRGPAGHAHPKRPGAANAHLEHVTGPQRTSAPLSPLERHHIGWGKRREVSGHLVEQRGRRQTARGDHRPVVALQEATHASRGREDAV